MEMNWPKVNIKEEGLSERVRALVGSPRRFPRLRVNIGSCLGSERKDGRDNQNEEPGPVHKSYSKSAGDLSRGKSIERSGEGSGRQGSRRDDPFCSEGTPHRKPTHPGRSKVAFITTLKNILGQHRRKDKKKYPESPKSNAYPYAPQEWPSDLSMDHQDSGGGYGGDSSSAEQSSATATPYTLSPRRRTNGHPRGPESRRQRTRRQNTSGSRGDPPETEPTHRANIEARRPDICIEASNILETSFFTPDIQDTDDPRIKALRDYSFFQLQVHLKKGTNLVPRDACVTRHKTTNRLTVGRCTSDPYVKIKVGGKVVFKSRTVYKDLNPIWDESCSLAIEDPFELVQIKVFDYDWGLQDDFMGMANIDLTKLELNKQEDLTVTLHEPGKFDYMGTISLTLTLVPKTQEEKEQYLQRGGSRLQEQQRRLKSQIWSSVVTIILVEGKDIPVMDRVGFADPYVKFRLGNEKYKSKVELRTLNPRWLEQFDFHLFEDQSQLLDISLWDKDPKAKDEFIGKCTLDLRNYEKENTHEVWLDLEGEGEINEGKVVGRLFLLLSISGTTSSTSISDLVTHKENPHEIRAITNKYRLWRTLHNLRDVGLLTVKVFKAQGLAAADFGVGKSDPFCVLELLNARLQTQTEYKTLTPCWNKIFTFDVKDIHSILEVTVYDEDRDHKVDFLGKMSVPLIKIKNGEKKWYALKDKKLRLRAKGNYPEILLECSIFWNPIRAAIETFDPKEEKYMQLEPRFKRQIFVRNVNRIRAVVVDAIDFGLYIKSCFEWESPLRSVVAFLLFILITYYFELYMLPAFLLLLFVKNYIVISIVGSRYYKDEDAESSGNEDEIDEDDKDKEEKKSIKERLQAIQEVIATVQNAIGYIASIVESVKNTFNFTVPFLSWLMVLVLLAILVVLYMVPCRFLVIFWGVNKFSRKLIRPHSVVNNEIMDFLSRVPDDEELKDYRELKTSFQSSDRREKKKKAAS